ncbi:MAG: ABC transporter ATP-binding protein [Deltaproteobacteria bacterium]|nr:ABC transporter ATP-binding protein [Deltaproteobacteria bacterium]
MTARAGGTTLLSSVDLTLHPGELCALIGPSGAGKSTLLKVLLGIREADGGTVRLGAGPPGAAGPVGYVPQRDALHGGLTVERTLHYAARLRLPDAPAGERQNRVLHAMGDVGLTDRRAVRVSRLSGGQQKRVSVALELLTSPGLLILDEPTSGLDPGLEAQLMALFATVARQGRVVLVATHAMESLGRCHVLVVLHEGRVAYVGPPAEASGYFGVTRFAAIFDVLKPGRGGEWHERCSSRCGAFLARPARVPDPGASA